MSVEYIVRPEGGAAEDDDEPMIIKWLLEETKDGVEAGKGPPGPCRKALPGPVKGSLYWWRVGWGECRLISECDLVSEGSSGSSKCEETFEMSGAGGTICEEGPPFNRLVDDLDCLTREPSPGPNNRRLLSLYSSQVSVGCTVEGLSILAFGVVWGEMEAAAFAFCRFRTWGWGLGCVLGSRHGASCKGKSSEFGGSGDLERGLCPFWRSCIAGSSLRRSLSRLFLAANALCNGWGIGTTAGKINQRNSWDHYDHYLFLPWRKLKSRRFSATAAGEP